MHVGSAESGGVLPERARGEGEQRARARVLHEVVEKKAGCLRGSQHSQRSSGVGRPEARIRLVAEGCRIWQRRRDGERRHCYYYGIGVRRNPDRASAALRRACRSTNITQYNREAAFYHLAVAFLDRGGVGNQHRARALLLKANADHDYPGARAVLNALDSGQEPRPCRCVRGSLRRLHGQAACAVHRRPVNKALHPRPDLPSIK
jgi:hypothetical protein